MMNVTIAYVCTSMEKIEGLFYLESLSWDSVSVCLEMSFGDRSALDFHSSPVKRVRSKRKRSNSGDTYIFDNLSYEENPPINLVRITF